MRTRQTITISIPPEMAEQVQKTMKAEHRTRSELVREALRRYISVRWVAEDTPTPSELRAIRLGQAEYRRGEFITLDDLRREERQQVARRPRQARPKGS